MATEEILDDYLTKEELARQLGKSTRTVERWAALRIGPPRTRVGASVLYAIADVRRWLEAQREDRPRRRRA